MKRTPLKLAVTTVGALRSGATEGATKIGGFDLIDHPTHPTWR